METPPIAGKKSFNSLTKSTFTPCRRLGLGRPSTGSLKKTHRVRTLTSPVEKQKEILLHSKNNLNEVSEETSSPTCEERVTFPLKESNVLQRRSRRCLTLSTNSSPVSSISNQNMLQDKDNIDLCNISKKRKLIEKECVALTNKQSEQSSNCIISDLFPDNNVTAEKIEQLALSIREKKKKLEQLKVQETYARKHNLVELKQQTTKWKLVGQEALRYSLNLAKQSGYSVSLKELMAQHGFLPHLMGYNSEDDEFD